MGTAVHKKLGNNVGKLAAAFLVGSAGGTFIGGYINKTLYDKDPLLSEHSSARYMLCCSGSLALMP